MSADPSRSKFRFSDARTLALWSRIALYLCALFALFAAASSWAHRGLLQDIQSGTVTVVESEEDLNVRDVSEIREVLITVVRAFAFVATAVLTLTWTYRTNANLRAMTNKPLEFTPGWAVGWYFVPIAALWKPYQMMKELWLQSAEDPEDPASTPWYLIVWWLSYNSMVLVGRASSRMFARAETPEAEIDAQTVDLVACLLAVPAALLFARLIQRIQEMHDARVRRNPDQNSPPPAEESPWR